MTWPSINLCLCFRLVCLVHWMPCLGNIQDKYASCQVGCTPPKSLNQIACVLAVMLLPCADRLPPFTGRLSLRTALTLFADVLSTPHKDVLASLSTFASDPEEVRACSHAVSKHTHAHTCTTACACTRTHRHVHKHGYKTRTCMCMHMPTHMQGLGTLCFIRKKVSGSADGHVRAWTFVAPASHAHTA